MVNRQLSQQLNQGKSPWSPLPKSVQSEVDVVPSLIFQAFCQADTILLHHSHGGEQSKEGSGQLMVLLRAWGQPSTLNPVSEGYQSFSS